MVYDVCIVGAGVTGAAIARELSRYQLKTVVLEKEADASFGTSKANSGIIHGGFHSKPGSLKAKLCVEGNAMFDTLATELNFPFKRIGALVVAFGHEDHQYLWKLYDQGKKNSVPGLCILSGTQLFDKEPLLNPDISSALYSPTVGIIGPYEFCFAMIENAQINGTEFSPDTEVINIDKTPDGFKVDLKGKPPLHCRYLVNAAGLFSDQISRYLGLNDFTILPRKGEEYLLDKRVASLVQHVIFPVPTAVSKGMLVIPTTDGPVMVGPTATDAFDREDFSTTAEGLNQVFEHAQKLIPAIRQDDIITAFAGLRPASSAEDFLVGPTAIKGYFLAAAIESPGLTASPAIALKLVRDLKDAGCPLQAKKDFLPERKRAPLIRNLIEADRLDEWEALATSDNGYTDIICRCENVTATEIRAAIARGHTTLDAMKFSTRAGSGRCQGGFCTHKILKILQKEGIDPFSVTKKGKGSELLTGGKNHPEKPV